jgi:hypothetical protein
MNEHDTARCRTRTDMDRERERRKAQDLQLSHFINKYSTGCMPTGHRENTTNNNALEQEEHIWTQA